MRQGGFLAALLFALLCCAPALAAEAATLIEVQGGRLSVSAEDVALGEIVQEIARQGAIRLFVGIPLEERVSANFIDLPIDVALRQLLRGYDCVFIADGRSASNVSLSEIRILRSVHAEAVSQAREVEAFVRETAASLSDADWRVRQDAVVTLGQARSDQAIRPLSTALRDADPRVREAAVEALGQLDKTKASDALTSALTDDDELVRTRAAELLAR